MSYPTTTICFQLPKAMGLIPSGRHQPCLHGCVLTVGSIGLSESLVRIDGPSREQVIEQALRFVRVHARGGLKIPEIACVIVGPGGRDGGWITVDAKVVFTYGAIEPVAERAPGNAA